MRGLFLLALSYHVGARSAQAQTGAQIEGANVLWTGTGNGFRVSGVVGRIMYWTQDNGSVHVVTAQIPGTQAIVASDPLGIEALADDGEVFKFNGSSWDHYGNLLPRGPVDVERHTLGQLKARFRDPSPQTGR